MTVPRMPGQSPTSKVSRESKQILDENDCPGHVASDDDIKVCRHCGIHIDELRPDEDIK